MSNTNLERCSWPLKLPYYHCTGDFPWLNRASLAGKTNTACTPPRVDPDRAHKIWHKTSASDPPARIRPVDLKLSPSPASTLCRSNFRGTPSRSSRPRADWAADRPARIKLFRAPSPTQSFERQIFRKGEKRRKVRNPFSLRWKA